MEQITEVARVYNILTAKLEHSHVPISLKEFCEMPELVGNKPTQVRDCLRHLATKGTVRRTPVFHGRDRVGYELARSEPVPAPVKKTAVEKSPQKDEIRIRVNSDKSVTVITPKLNITLEIQS